MMGQGLLDRIQAKLELFRLEKRYTRRRHLRSTFVSNAVYVDGEYVYQTPNSTGSSTHTHQASADALHGEKASPTTMSTRKAASSSTLSHPSFTFPTDVDQKPRINRFSSLPGFGAKSSGRTIQRQSSALS